jgi:hypothetical protein
MTNPVEIFTIRLWREKLDERESEWRGRVQHLGSGQARYFNEIGKIMEFIGDHLSKSKEETATLSTTAVRVSGPRIRYPLKQRSRRGRTRLAENPPAGSQLEWSLRGTSLSKPSSKEGGERHLLKRVGEWIGSRLFPLRKSLIVVFAILLFVGDWAQISWLGPRLHSLVAMRPETFFVGLVGLPRSLKSGGRRKRLFQLRKSKKN